MKNVLLAAVFALAGGSFFSCSSSSSDDEPFVMNERAITIQKGYKYTITHTGKASWSSEDNFVASVNDGEVTANHVGETAIYAMSGGSKSQCNVTVRGLYNYFREPLCKLNATPEDVMRYWKPDYTCKFSHGVLADWDVPLFNMFSGQYTLVNQQPKQQIQIPGFNDESFN